MLFDPAKSIFFVGKTNLLLGKPWLPPKVRNGIRLTNPTLAEEVRLRDM
jgi:hypothetical protein